MPRTAREHGSTKPAPGYRNIDAYDQDLNEMSSEPKVKLRRHDMVEFSDLFLNHDDEMRLDRGQDW